MKIFPFNVESTSNPLQKNDFCQSSIMQLTQVGEDQDIQQASSQSLQRHLQHFDEKISDTADSDIENIFMIADPSGGKTSNEADSNQEKTTSVCKSL